MAPLPQKVVTNCLAGTEPREASPVHDGRLWTSHADSTTDGSSWVRQPCPTQKTGHSTPPSCRLSTGCCLNACEGPGTPPILQTQHWVLCECPWRTEQSIVTCTQHFDRLGVSAFNVSNCRKQLPWPRMRAAPIYGLNRWAADCRCDCQKTAVIGFHLRPRTSPAMGLWPGL